LTFSLNEIEVMGKRAARGAGLDWGIAEEAGKAARWLSAHGLPGPELLAELLTSNEGKGYDELVPISLQGVWRAKSGRLCPLIAGAALSDRAGEVAVLREFELGPVAFPLLLAPYAAMAATSCGAKIEVSWPGVTLTIAPGDGLAVEGDLAVVATRRAKGAHCRLAVKDALTASAGEPGRAVGAETWRRLDAFAQRTFAPATEASRARGAGEES
jgi:hypothetical protein